MDPLRLYDYLTRARTRVFGWVRPLSDDRYRAEHPIGLGSLARTLHHMMGAEWSYMRRVRGEQGPLTEPALEHNPEVTTQEALPFADVERIWTAQAHDTRADLERITDWSTTRVYETAWNGEPLFYKASIGDFVSQLVLHEVHHRAQVLHMLRRTGVETEDIDYNGTMWAHVDAP